MSEHKVTLSWNRGDAPFEYQKYPRNHTWKFDGGHEMTATADSTPTTLHGRWRTRICSHSKHISRAVRSHSGVR